MVIVKVVVRKMSCSFFSNTHYYSGLLRVCAFVWASQFLSSTWEHAWWLIGFSSSAGKMGHAGMWQWQATHTTHTKSISIWPGLYANCSCCPLTSSNRCNYFLWDDGGWCERSRLESQNCLLHAHRHLNIHMLINVRIFFYMAHVPTWWWCQDDITVFLKTEFDSKLVQKGKINPKGNEML